ncbi:hypothetical protein [Campylobacter sp. CCUG 57310]|uniref:hypothetical protein n=1 Tax=Campylobacter sp. CCUG 57310 TaxID=2517362 RepID=UPI001566CFCC|nr:hypothetical protein [Campylobacter sp. CCUG 57310]QKF93232.1 hypothetical protein CORI_a046 [Campylobacter sp. CCUG 57310]
MDVMEEVVNSLAELGKTVKSTRIDLNTMTKHFKNENSRVTKVLESLINEINGLDERFTELEEKFSKIEEQNKALKSFGNSNAGASISDTERKAIFDDLQEREKRLVEQVQKQLDDFYKRNRRKKFLGIF